jgi:hypothetical protein
MKIEVFDERGRREYVEYHNLQVRLSVREDFFTPAGRRAVAVATPTPRKLAKAE